MIIIGQLLNVDINQLRTKARTNYKLSLLSGIHICTCTRSKREECLDT